MSRSFNISNDFTFETNIQTTSVFDISVRSAKPQFDVIKQQDINTWLQLNEISYPSDLIPQKFSKGELFCELIQRNSKKRLKYIKNPKSTKESMLNIRKALGYLRTLSEFKSNYI